MLPLALGMAGAMAKDQPLRAATWRTVHDKLQVEVIKLEDMKSDEMTSEYNTIKSTIEASVEALPKTARKRFLMMAVMAPGVAANSEMLANLWNVVNGLIYFACESLVRHSLGKYYHSDCSALILLLRCRTAASNKQTNRVQTV